MSSREIRVGHVFCGIGAGAKGFNKGHARVGSTEARFRCIGGIDVDAGAVREFGRIAGCPGTVLDLFARDQYMAFHGREPPADWREATPADYHHAFHGERPHILFLSAPCKGFSGLLSESRSLSAKYQALNQLALRGVMLALEAFKDDPIELILFENVPRIQTRGRTLLDQIEQLLAGYGYVSAETTHDCGELGGLAQTRKRFLLVARHVEKVPPFLYEPVKRPLRAVGDVLGRMPLPGDPAAGQMHRIPALQWKTWVRLAFVRAGKDWRDLQRLRVEDGFLADYAIAPDADYHAGVYGVQRWGQPSTTITSQAGPSNGNFAVADPRIEQSGEYGQLGVREWDQPTGTITSQSSVGGRPHAVADPRVSGVPYNHVYRIVAWDQAAPAVTSANGGTASSVADPRPRDEFHGGKYRVTRFDEPAGTIIAASTTGNGAFAVADPRCKGEYRDSPYGVMPWDGPSGAVIANLRHDNGFHSVADPRLPAPDARIVAVIRALDGTWHRPFTTLDMAALQSLFDPEERFTLEGRSDSQHREWIGNAVPPDAAAAIAGVMGTTLLLAWAGETFVLGSTPIWVRDVAIALSVARPA